MALDNTKYDIYLNGVGYRLGSYQKSELEPFAPRFGGGEQSETDLDLFKGKSIKSFDDGMLQRRWDLDTMAYSIEGMYPKYGDGVLYPTPHPEELAYATKANYEFYGTREYLFRFRRTFNTPTNSASYSLDGVNWTSVSLGATGFGAAPAVTDACVRDNKLYIATGSTSKFYIDLDTPGTMVVLGLSHGMTKVVTFRDLVYYTGTAGQNNGALYQRTATGSAFNKIGVAGDEYNAIDKLVVFNHRIMIAKPDGLFAYDGVAITAVIDYSKNIHNDNFKFMSVLNGWLYYFMPDGMYRFNGVTIEKLYDIADIGFPVDAVVGGDRYWILHKHDGAEYNRYEKSMGFDLADTEFNGRISCFNGRGLYLYSRLSVASFDKASNEIDFEGQGQPYKLSWWIPTVSVDGGGTPIPDLTGRLFISRLYTHNGANLVLSTGDDGTLLNGFSGLNSAQIVSSIFDADLPFIEKYLESIEIVFDGTDTDVDDGTAFVVEYRTSGFDGGTGWLTYGTIYANQFKRSSGWINDVDVSFKQCQFRVYPLNTVPDTLGIKKIVMRYALNPELKFEWNLTLLAFGGDNPNEPLILADGTEGTDSVRTLRGNIYASRESDDPVELVDLDPSTLSTAIVDTGEITEIVVTDGSLYTQSGIVQIDDEKFIYYSKSGNTLYLKPGANITPPTVRGLLGSTAAAHTAGKKVYLIHRVFIRRIINERINIDGSLQSVNPSTINIQIQEA